MAAKTSKKRPTKAPEKEPIKTVGGLRQFAPKVRHRNQVKKGKHGGMLLVLVNDVDHLGKSGELVEVKPGYGRNYLLPNGLATIPTDHNLRLIERFKQRLEQAREARIVDLKSLAGQLKDVTVSIHSKATDEGHLYGSVGGPEISKALRSQNLMVDPDMIKLDMALKELGLYEVKLNLGHDIETSLKVLIDREAD